LRPHAKCINKNKFQKLKENFIVLKILQANHLENFSQKQLVCFEHFETSVKLICVHSKRLGYTICNTELKNSSLFRKQAESCHYECICKK
jgi:hypothetical protein